MIHPRTDHDAYAESCVFSAQHLLYS